MPMTPEARIKLAERRLAYLGIPRDPQVTARTQFDNLPSELRQKAIKEEPKYYDEREHHLAEARKAALVRLVQDHTYDYKRLLRSEMDKRGLTREAKQWHSLTAPDALV